MMKSNKRGFFFIFDFILAVVIFVVGITLILSSYSSDTPLFQVAIAADDFMNQLAYTPINSYRDSIILDLRFAGEFSQSDERRSVLHAIVKYYEDADFDTAKHLVGNLSGTYLPETYNTAFYIDGTVIYDRQITLTTQDDAEYLISSKKLFYTLDEQKNEIGPYVVEVRIW